VPDAQFIASYVQAALEFEVEYTPIVWGAPGLFEGAAAFPSNDWSLSPNGEEYLARISGGEPPVAAAASQHQPLLHTRCAARSQRRR